MSHIKLQKVAKLLDFGAECFREQKINIMKMRGSRKIVFPMIIAAHNYSEAIFVLCKANRTHPCFSLLRSLLENLININFLYCSPKKHHHIILLNGLVEKKKQLDDVVKYLTKHPQFCERQNLSDVIKALDDVLKKEKKVKTKLKKHQENLIKSVYARARYVDEYNQLKNQKSESLEWLYIYIHRTLSSSTHINFLDFKNYFKFENSETVVFLSGNPDDTEAVLDLLNYLYKEALETFLKIFKSPLKNQFIKLKI